MGNKFYLGVDLGRRHDSTALVRVEVDEKKNLVVRVAKELKNMPFEGQLAEIKRSAQRPDVVSMAVDETGMGLPVVERLRAELPGMVEPITFTQGSKAELIARTVSLLQDDRLRLPKHAKLREQLHSIQRQISLSGNILYRTADSYDSPDLAWALMLAVHAARNELVGTSETLPIFTDPDRNIIDVENPR